MGFTVTGPCISLASGHLSPTDPTATSPHLGLIRRTDAAQTWTTASAAGEADFPSLQQAGPTPYDLDSQTSPGLGRHGRRRHLGATCQDPGR